MAEYLTARRMLLVLDNCEHVIAATAEFVTELLRQAPPRVEEFARKWTALAQAGPDTRLRPIRQRTRCQKSPGARSP